MLGPALAGAIRRPRSHHVFYLQPCIVIVSRGHLRVKRHMQANIALEGVTGVKVNDRGRHVPFVDLGRRSAKLLIKMLQLSQRRNVEDNTSALTAHYRCVANDRDLS